MALAARSDKPVGAGDDLVPYDKYLHQGSQATWLPATASPDTMSPISICSLFDFAMTLPEVYPLLHYAICLGTTVTFGEDPCIFGSQHVQLAEGPVHTTHAPDTC